MGMGAGEIANRIRSVLVRRPPLPNRPRQMSKEETAQPAAVALAVASPVDLNDLDSRSSDSRSTRRRIMAREEHLQGS